MTRGQTIDEQCTCGHQAWEHGAMGECERPDLRTSTGWCKCRAFSEKTGTDR